MTYSPEQIETLFDSVLLEIEKWRPVRQILQDKWMPSWPTFYIWLANDEEKTKRYARACDVRAESIFDEMLEIADDNSKDIKVDKEWNEVVNQDNIQRARLKIDARKWVLWKLNPKKFWDKVDMTSGGEKITNYIITTNLHDKGSES